MRLLFCLSCTEPGTYLGDKGHEAGDTLAGVLTYHILVSLTHPFTPSAYSECLWTGGGKQRKSPKHRVKMQIPHTQSRGGNTPEV